MVVPFAIDDRNNNDQLISSNEDRNPYIQELKLNLDTIEKGGYPHFMIKEIFEQENIEEILNKTYSLSQNGSEFSKNTEHELKGKSPTSLKITFKQIHMATEMSLRDALIMEYRMVQRCQASGDFYEGVRAMLVDKDRNPQWKPSNLDKVDEIWVNHFFEPLHEKDLKI